MPHFANGHTRCLATGLALYNKQCYYASGAGPQTTVKSIWASLVGQKSKIFCHELHGNLEFSFGGVKGTYGKYQALPNCIYKHFLVLNPTENAIMLFEPKCAGLEFSESQSVRFQRMPEVYDQFYVWFKKNIDVPIEKNWVSEIWHSAREESPTAIEAMDVFGDCIAGYMLDPKFKWAGHVSDLVSRRKLRITERTYA